MNNTAAALLALAIVALILADIFLNGVGALTFLGRRLIQLTEYLAFWR